MSSFQERLKRIRTEKGFTLEELSATLGVPFRTIYSYEKAERVPTVKYLERLYECLQVNLNWLISGKGTIFLQEGATPSCEQLLRDEYGLTDKESELIKVQLDLFKKQKKL